MVTLIELKFLSSSFSCSNCSIRVVRAYPLIEIRQTVPCRASRAIRGSSISVDSTLPPLRSGVPKNETEFLGAVEASPGLGLQFGCQEVAAAHALDAK